jgi:membrane protease subunit HflC
MQAYEVAFKSGDTRFLIGPRSDFFRFFGAPGGQKTPLGVSATVPDDQEKRH